MADVSVRPARPEDAAEIGRIQIETWQVAYTEILPEPIRESLTIDAAVAAWTAAITTPPSPRHHVLVALEQEWSVGFVALAPSEDEDALRHGGDAPIQGASTVEIATMLVEPRWGRRGHGSRLLAAAIDHARGDGMTTAIAWIPEQDEASRAFLSSAGWAPDGMVRALDTGAGELREIRLHVEIG
ncbi:MAG TPA: GNAT family N-acetyltransferase [Jatrophihabitans sp.]|jgi:GNAT superfamily N-acetyltransferase